MGVPAITTDHPLSSFLPPDPAHLTSGGFAAVSSQSKSFKTQRVVSAFILHRRWLSFRHSLTNSPPAYLTPSDTSHLLSVTSRCLTTRILRSPTWPRLNRLSPQQFVAWGCFHLNLPQHAVWHDRLLHGDYGCDVCRVAHDVPMPLDVNGDHCCSCPSQTGARYSTHFRVGLAVLAAARTAGLTANREPPTASLLGNTYSAEQCRVLFPHGRRTNVDKAVFDAGQQLQSVLDSTTDLAQRAIATAALTELAAAVPPGGKGLRIDLQLSDDLASGVVAEKWIDFSIVHNTAASRRSKTLNALRAEQAADPVAPAANGHLQPPVGTPATTDSAHLKDTKYDPLLFRGRSLFAAGKLPNRPDFVAAIATHSGELGIDFASLIEWVVRCYRTNTAPAHANLLGSSKAKNVAAFRSATLDSVAAAIAGGWAQQLLSVGFPLTS